MTSISVIHDHPTDRGGAEAVFMHVLDALQRDYDVTAVTAESFDLQDINNYFHTTVQDVETRTPSLRPVDWQLAYGWVERLTSGKLGVLDTRRLGLFHWAAVREADTDIIIHTKSESPYGNPSIQYIHHPMYRRYDTEALENPDSRVLAFIEKLTTPLRDIGDFPPDALFLTNSQWTARDIKRVYGIDSTVCHPPVTTADLPEPLGDSKRENAVLMVGRLSPAKRQYRAFEIIEEVRARGFNLGLTIVGPISDTNYAAEIERSAATREWATVLGELSRGELVDLLATHRYGLHAHAREHFGIVVAEMVAAGVLPLVPNDGGQVEIVNGLPELTWESQDEVIDLFCNLCDNERLRREVREKLPSIEERYGTERFHDEIRGYVKTLLGG